MRVLILAQWDWHGPARIPRALRAVGFEVAAICKKGDLTSKSGFVDHFYFTDTSQESAIVDTLRRALDEWRPAIVLPATDNMVGTLQVVRRLVEQSSIELDEEMAQVIKDSSFPLDKDRFTHGKIDLLEELRGRGVAVAPQRELATFADADTFVSEHGYPVVLKPDQGFAGAGIRFCHDEPELLAALNELLLGSKRERFCIQKHLGRKTALIEFVAKDGKMLAANAVSRIQTYPGDTGPTSVARVVAGKTMRRATEEMCDILGYNGIGVAQFMVTDDECEDAYLIELNPRMSSFIHLWKLMGTDLCEGLKRAWSGQRVTIQPVRTGLTVALYPQEWLRDRDSEFKDGVRDRVEGEPELSAYYEGLIEKRWQATQPEANSDPAAV